VKTLKTKKIQLPLLAFLFILLITVLYFQRAKIADLIHVESEAPRVVDNTKYQIETISRKEHERPIADDNAKYQFKAFSGLVEIGRDLAAVSPRGETPTALDGMNVDQLTKFRLEHVGKYRQLGFFHPGYSPFSPPHNQIYKHITPGAPWLYSVPYYVSNPYLLIILVLASHVSPIDIYVPDVAIRYKNGVIRETIRGTSAQTWSNFVYASPDYPGQIRPVMVNAWDAGFYYIYLDRQRSRNIQLNKNPDHVSNAPYSLSCFFHVGKYKKNNLSPESRQSWVALAGQNKPTCLYFKLWRHMPVSVSDRADLIFIFDIDPKQT
jgi:hypothetical protein